MLVQCQVCDRNISDSASACPACASLPAKFLGTLTKCAECGGDYHSAYPNCLNCGAPRTVALQPPHAVRDIADEIRADTIHSSEANLFTAPAGGDGHLENPTEKNLDTKAPTEAPFSAKLAKVAADRPKKSRSGFVGGILACLAVVGGISAYIIPKLVGGAIGYTAAQALRSPSAAAPNTASIDEMWARMESDPDMGEFLTEFRTSFPEEQDRFTDALLQHWKTSKDRSQDARIGYDWMRSFIARNAHFVGQASDTTLSLIADQSVKVGLLLQKEDISKCAAYAMDGDIGPSPQASKELKREMASMSLLMLRGIKSGKLNRVQRNDPTEAQFMELGEAIVETGADPVLLESLGDGSIVSSSDRDKCTVGIATLTAMADMPLHESAFWTAFNITEGAKTAKK